MSGLPSLPQHLWGLKKNKQDTVLRTLISGTQNPELYIIQDQDCRILNLKVIDYKNCKPLNLEVKNFQSQL